MSLAETLLSPEQQQNLERSRQATLAALLQVDDSTLLELSRLTLPEIQQVREEIAQIFPAGNLLAFVLSGLVKLKGRQVSVDHVRRDVSALLRGISLIPQGLYGLLIAGPAAALTAYQKILQLSGKDLNSAFPEGTWQFYLTFALREDTARHANETVGFQRALPNPPEPVAAAAAWLCAALELLYRYDELLAADWSERVMLRLALDEAGEVGRPPWSTLLRDWNERAPYHHPADGVDYLLHRQATFHEFLQERLRLLSPAAHARFQQRYQARVDADLAPYLTQMSLLAALDPERYQERREPIPLWQAAVGFVWQGHTYLLPACQRDERGSPLCYPPAVEQAAPLPLYALPGGPLCDAAGQPLHADRSGQVWSTDGRLLGTLRPPTPESVLGWVSALLDAPPPGPPPTLDLLLVESPRALQAELRRQLPAATQAELVRLRRAPLLINWDWHRHNLPLAVLRRDHRGIGDHALTILRTGQSIVFDQSHIFFDGMGGVAVAEIMTDSAVHWYRRLAGRPFVPPPALPQPLALLGSAAVDEAARSQHPAEAAAESDGVDTRQVRRLRRWLQQRGVRLTVNDLLLLYRSFHAASYLPSPATRQALDAFRARAASPEARAVVESVDATLDRLRQTNPALLIPMDARNVNPRERVFPTTFRNPLTEMRELWSVTLARQQACHEQPDGARWAAFDQARRELLAYLQAFGELLDALKAVTMRGESFNTATIRMLAHLPPSLQHLLDQIPQHVGVLNEIVKGSEVFSNIGRVAPGSCLTRFVSARDDGEAKELIWSLMTDDEDRMHVSLRDFRAFVPQLLALGEHALADRLAEDYVQSYVEGLNEFVARLAEIVTEKQIEQ